MKVARFRNAVIILITVIIILVGLLAWLFFSNRILFSSMENTRTEACNDEVVAQYNDASTVRMSKESSSYTTDKSAQKKIVEQIKSSANQENDATCQMIVLMYAVDSNDYNLANNAYQKLLKLHKEGLYVNSNLRTGGTLSDYENFVIEIDPSKAVKDRSIDKAAGGS